MSVSAIRLGDSHLDLILSAATQWRVLSSRGVAEASPVEQNLVAVMANQVGQQIRAENDAAIKTLVDRGQADTTQLGESTDRYHFTPVDHMVVVEVIKAVHAARDACRHSASWHASQARRWLDAVLIAATYRVDGYTAAPWLWTRPQLREGRSIGVANDPSDHLPLPGLHWVTPGELSEYWHNAPLVIIRADAALLVPAELPARTGVFVLAEDDPDQQQIWTALTSLDMAALALFWPSCQPWLLEQLADPAPEYCTYRSAS